MSERISPDAITAVPTEDIARWVARIDLINFALENNLTVHVGGMADDGIMYDYMVRQTEQGVDWRTLPAFESAIIYEMKPTIGYDKVVNGPNQYMNHPQYGEGKDVSMDITRAALREGLGRIGLYSAEEPHVPVDALAALHYIKGNIKDPIDRKLAERCDEIDEAALAIRSVVTARKTTRQVQRPTKDGWVKEYMEFPVYRMVPSNHDADKIRALGLDPDSGIEPWWQELNSDLARLDAAANGVKE